ncbi:MAG: O-antigen ligase family protein [Lachnospiraceae bacterium]|nr:O-antigen ligase family protein [Lachnospiraceae bacterium]
MKLATKSRQPKLSVKYLIPSILAVGLIPFLMRIYTYDNHLGDYDWYPNGGGTADVFLFYKQWAVVVLACICIILLLVRANYYYEELPVGRFMIPAGIYGVMVLVSAIFGKSPLFSFAGSYEMFESALALLGYLVIAYYTYTCIVSVDHLRYFLRGSEYFVLVELALATFQGLGLDLFATDFGKRLIAPMSFWDKLDTISVVAGERQAYGTIYNVDFFSMYTGVLVPIFIALIFVEEKLWRKLLNAALCVLAVYVSFHGALSGFVGILGALVIAALVLLSRRRKTFIIGLVVLAVLVGGGVAVLETSSSLKKQVSTILVGTIPNWDENIPIPEDGIFTGDNNVKISFKDGRTLVFSYSLDTASGIVTFDAKDGEGQALNLKCTSEYDQTYACTDSDWKDISFGLSGDSQTGYYVYVNIPSNAGADCHFSFIKGTEEGDYYFVNSALKGIKMPTGEDVEVANVFPDRMFSGRGHIYNRSIPLLRHHMIIGTGADCFVLAYPQWEYINKSYWVGPDKALFDVKPHCYYLQLWIENGFIAFAAAVVFFFWYLFQSARLYRKAVFKDAYTGTLTEAELKDKLVLARMGFGISTGVLAYLIVVLANDSTICTGPVFWTILGAGWGVNALVRRELGEPEEKPLMKFKK